MAVVTRVFVASLLLFSLLVLHLVEADQVPSTITGAQSTPTTTTDCGATCAGGCQRSSTPHPCNNDACPCHATVTTHGNEHKCP